MSLACDAGHAAVRKARGRRHYGCWYMKLNPLIGSAVFFASLSFRERAKLVNHKHECTDCKKVKLSSVDIKIWNFAGHWHPVICFSLWVFSTSYLQIHPSASVAMGLFL